jgi:subtilisin family serine protease
MTAQIEPRLSALLADLGIEHGEGPVGRIRSLADDDPNSPRPGAPRRLVLDVEPDVDVAALEAAGLHFIRGTGVVRSGVANPVVVPDLAAVPGVLRIDLETSRAPEIHDSVPATKANLVRTGPFGLTGAGVVVGVVDSGIDIYHRAFRNADGTTRLLGLLDTTAPYTLTASGGPTAGAFTLSWIPPAGQTGAGVAQTTPSLPFNATVQQVRAAMESIAAISPGDLLATGGPLPGAPVVFSFAGKYLRKDVEPITVVNSTVPSPAVIAIERGREYTEEQINTALANPEAPFGSWDEDGHGTHVMGIAAGNGSQAGTCEDADHYIGVAPGASLVAAKTTFDDDDTTEGVDFVFRVAGTRAAVVNLSLGGDSGAHNGTDSDERHFDGILTGTNGRAIVISAGNSGARYDHSANPRTQPRSGGGTHSLKTVPAGLSTTMSVVIRPNDKEDDWFEFWYGGTGRLTLELADPSGATTDPIAVDDPTYEDPLSGHPLWISNRINRAFTNRHRIAVRLSPPTGGTIATGTWVFTLTETASQDTPVDCWIHGDKVDPHPRFINDDQDRTRTLTSPATAKNVVAIANYDYRDSRLAESSSRGPTVDTRPAGETKPDVAAPGTGIWAARSGVTNPAACCECCTDFYVSMSGTSMAAPHVTGVVALMLQLDPTLTFDDVRRHLRDTADPPDPATAPNLPDHEWGAGVVNAEAAVAAVDAAIVRGAFPVVLPSGPQTAPPRLPATVPAALAQLRPGAPAAARLDELRARVQSTPAGMLAASLVSTHVDEIVRLIRTDRRVTVAWHRMGGPALFTMVLAVPPGDPVAIPSTVDGRSVAAGLATLLDALERQGSLPLRADVARYRDLVLALPGMELSDLEHLDVAG